MEIDFDFDYDQDDHNEGMTELDAILNIKNGCKKAVFIGDIKQMGPRIYSSKVRDQNLGVSILERLMHPFMMIDSEGDVAASLPDDVAASLPVKTIDAMQGGEADYVIVSLVRSKGTPSPGFLDEKRRQCVFLSF